MFVHEFKTVFKNNWTFKVYFTINGLIIFNLLYRIIVINNNSLDLSDVFYNYLSIPFSFVITLFGFKLIIISFLLVEDLVRICIAFYNFFFSQNESNSFFLNIRNFVSKSIKDVGEEKKLEKIVNIVEKSESIVVDKIIKDGLEEEQGSDKVIKIISKVIEKNPEKAIEILEKNKKTKDLAKIIKTKIENKEAVIVDYFDKVFKKNITPN